MWINIATKAWFLTVWKKCSNLIVILFSVSWWSNWWWGKRDERLHKTLGYKHWRQGAVLILESVSIQTSFGWAGGTESSQEIPIISTKQASSLFGILWASPVCACLDKRVNRESAASPFNCSSICHELLFGFLSKCYWTESCLGLWIRDLHLVCGCKTTRFLVWTKTCQKTY